MIDINIKSKNCIEINIDCNVFNDTVISKVLYWLSGKYIIGQRDSDCIRTVCIEKLKGEFSQDEFLMLKRGVSQKFIDFKTRDIIQKETKSIKEILIIKAFANDDDFDDYNLINDENVSQKL